MAYVVNDPMVDTNGVSLVAHTPTTGGPWVQHPVHSGVWLCASNRFYPSVIGAVYASGAPATAEYDVLCDFRYISDTGSVGIVARVSTSAQTFYNAYYLAGQWVMTKHVAGTITNIGALTEALTPNTTYALRFEIRNATKKLFVNGVEKMSSTDNVITAAGLAGVRAGSTVTSTTGKHISNFRLDDLTIPSTPTNESFSAFMI
jgi:hypothetical protein